MPLRMVRGAASGRTTSITVEQHHSFVSLPDEPLLARPYDPRTANSAATLEDYGESFDGDYRTRAVARWRHEMLESGIVELPLGGGICIAAARLQDFHADPADRFLVDGIDLGDDLRRRHVAVEDQQLAGQILALRIAALQRHHQARLELRPGAQIRQSRFHACGMPPGHGSGHGVSFRRRSRNIEPKRFFHATTKGEK